MMYVPYKASLLFMKWLHGMKTSSDFNASDELASAAWKQIPTHTFERMSYMHTTYK